METLRKAAPLILRLHNESPRFECDWVGAQVGLGVVLKQNKYSPFRYELVLIIGPLLCAVGVWRVRR